MTFTPLCMDEGEFAAWRAANARCSPAYRAPRPCFDCPVAFASEMRLVGRCNGAMRQDKPTTTPEARLVQWRTASARRRERVRTGERLRTRRSSSEVRILEQQIAEMMTAGMDASAVARHLGLTANYVRELRARVAA